jgi:hypothetical protein
MTVVLLCAAAVLLLAPAAGLATPSVPLQAAEEGSGACDVMGYVRNLDGTPAAGAQVTFSGGERYTSDKGYFEILGLDASDDMRFGVYLPDSDHTQDCFFSTRGHRIVEGRNEVVLQPGAIEFTLAAIHAPRLRVTTYGANGWAHSTILNGHEGPALAAPGECTYAIAYPSEQSVIEWTGPSLTITPGVVSGPIVFDQADAMHFRIESPRWQSGKPGMTVKLAFANWPAGYKIYPAGHLAQGGLTRTWPTITASGESLMTRSVQIPTTVKAGSEYVMSATGSSRGIPLLLVNRLQIATLKSSKTSIVKGGSFLLSGVVPVGGFWGSARGKPKTVTLYKRTTSSGQPKYYDATRSGWKKVDTYKTDGYGRFVTRYFKPQRTTWYIVRYPSDPDHFRAFTSVHRVPVK